MRVNNEVFSKALHWFYIVLDTVDEVQPQMHFLICMITSVQFTLLHYTHPIADIETYQRENIHI